MCIVAVAENRKNRSRDDDRPKRHADNATGRKRNQDGARYFPSTGDDAPPARIAPAGEIILRPGRTDGVDEAGASECDNQEPDCKGEPSQSAPIIIGMATRTMIIAVRP